MKIKLAITATVLTIIGLIALTVYAFVDFNNWQKACVAAGGEVEERWEYTELQTQFTYDAKGNISSVIVVPVDHYSYHCWVNHQEIEVVY